MPAPRAQAWAPSVGADADAIERLRGLRLPAALQILGDFERNAFAVPRGRRLWLMIERSPTYYSARSGDIPLDRAEWVMGALVPLLRGCAVDPSEAAALGYPVRQLRAGERYGCFWVFEHGARLALLVAELRRRGHAVGTADRYETAVEVPVHRRGRRRYLLCPCHTEHEPSALVNEDGRVYCFGACRRFVGMASPGADGTVRFSRLVVRSDARPSPPEPLASHRPESARRRTGGVDHSGGAEPAANAAEWSVVAVARAGRPGPKPDRARLDTVKLTPTGAHDERTHHTDLIELLRKADRDLAGDGAYEVALDALARQEQDGADHRAHLPELLVCPALRTGSRFSPTRYPLRLLATGFVGVDLDGFTDAPGSNRPIAEVAREVQAAIVRRFPALSGRFAVVRTSVYGVQAAFQLRQHRWDSAGFFADEDVRRMLFALGRFLLDALRGAGFVGGKVDPSMFSAGHLMRRPGARKTKQGTLYVSRLVYATD